MNENLTPTLRFRWRQVYRRDDGSVAVSVPSWPECGPDLYVLEQGFVMPDGKSLTWCEVEIDHSV